MRRNITSVKSAIAAFPDCVWIRADLEQPGHIAYAYLSRKGQPVTVLLAMEDGAIVPPYNFRRRRGQVILEHVTCLAGHVQLTPPAPRTPPVDDSEYANRILGPLDSLQITTGMGHGYSVTKNGFALILSMQPSGSIDALWAQEHLSPA